MAVRHSACLFASVNDVGSVVKIETCIAYLRRRNVIECVQSGSLGAVLLTGVGCWLTCFGAEGAAEDGVAEIGDEKGTGISGKLVALNRDVCCRDWVVG